MTSRFSVCSGVSSSFARPPTRVKYWLPCLLRCMTRILSPFIIIARAAFLMMTSIHRACTIGIIPDITIRTTMRRLLLEKIRLSQYFVLLFILFSVTVILAPDLKFDSGALTLFSVNSFLYGFYIAPILSAQKSRIEELHRIVRAESNAIFAMVISLKKLPKPLRNEIQEFFITYLKSSI